MFPISGTHTDRSDLSVTISNYDEQIAQKEQAGEIDYDKEWAEATAYNQELLPTVLPDSFAVAAASEEDDEGYMSSLNLNGDGMMGYVAEATAYNQELLPTVLPDSFAVAAASEEDDEGYMSSLNLNGDGMMGYVEIPKIDVKVLLPTVLPDSFAVAAASEEDDEGYMSSLNLNGDGMMGYVEIPKIDVKVPIYHTTEKEVLEKAAGKFPRLM